MSAPKILHVNCELVSACNLKCIFCTRDPSKRPNYTMTMDQFSVVIDKLKQCKSISVETELRYFLSGEPFLQPNIFEMIKYGRQAGFIFSLIHTNGTMLKEEYVDKLVSAGLQEISISFDGDTKEVYEASRVGSSFDKVYPELRKFVARASGSPLKVIVQSIVPAGGDINARRANIVKMFPGANMYFVRHPHQWNTMDAIKTAIDISGKRKGPCMFPQSFFPIYANGDVPMCCADLNGDRIIGNVFEQSVTEIWEKKFGEIRRSMLHNEYIEGCDKCERWGVQPSGSK